MISTAPTPTIEAAGIVSRVRELAGDASEGGRVVRGDPVVEISSDAVNTLAEALRDDAELGFEQLIDLTAVHWPADVGREFELVYQYRSLSNNLFLRVKTRVCDGGSVATLAHTYQSARWLEREVHDLFGVRFEGHPDLRRVLLPEGYEGHPLRKDYPVEGPTFPEDAHRNDLFGQLDPDDFWDEPEAGASGS
ncbi:MAG: NADH-quinone oxidoreductase subunit C [Chloroflexi bacterium]|nr:NADH-quinone oxidoreductase subunit C [Chloroflexota bacterium]